MLTVVDGRMGGRFAKDKMLTVLDGGEGGWIYKTKNVILGGEKFLKKKNCKLRKTLFIAINTRYPRFFFLNHMTAQIIY